MAKTGYVNVRMEKRLKAEAEKVLREVGVNASDALTMFYKQVVIQQGLPFEVCTRSHIPNATTRRALAALERGAGRTYKGTTTDIFDAILKDK